MPAGDQAAHTPGAVVVVVASRETMGAADMMMGEEFLASQRHEARRIEFLEQSRGDAAARAFAAQTMRLYRRAVLSHAPPAGDQAFRLRLLASYCYLKRYLYGS